MRTIEIRKNNPRNFPKRKNPLYFLLFLSLVLVLFAIFVKPANLLRGFLKPISVFSQITGAGKLASDDNHTNIIILGLDRRFKGEGGLSDTMIVASIEAKKGEVILFSIPRDVWVKNYRTKANALYAFGGVDLARKVLGQMLNLPIHYYLVLDFAGFERAVDALSGIEVFVERSFEDFRYPVPGREVDDCGGTDPEFECRYEHLSFQGGWQKMDGQTALKFSRSRHSSGPEGSDFARALRQQKVIIAFKNKVLSLSTLINPSTISKLYEEYKSSVETNLGLFEAEQLYDISQNLKDKNIRSFVINKDNSGADLLFAPADFSPYDGQWVLLPRTSDFSEIQSFIQKTLFGAR